MRVSLCVYMYLWANPDRNCMDYSFIIEGLVGGLYFVLGGVGTGHLLRSEI